MLLILDVDGVLTDGKKYYDNTGKCVMKTFCDRDFTAIKKLRCAGMKVVWLSGDRIVNESVAKNRHIPFYCNRENTIMVDKVTFIERFEKEYNTTAAEMLYVGDDIFDVNIMRKVFCSFCPYDAPAEVRTASKIVLKSRSGQNVLTELYELLIENSTITAPSIDEVMKLDQSEIF